MTKVQTIRTPSGETLAVLPIAEYRALLDALDAAHARASAEGVARGDVETLLADELDAYLEAPTPLAFWRARRGLTQATLAGMVGISQSYVAGLESGARKGDPSLFLRLSKALGVSMESLVVDDAMTQVNDVPHSPP